MVRQPEGPPRWLPRVVARIRRLALEGRVRFTHKALSELAELEPAQEVWAGPQLQEDACPRCGALMRPRRGRLSFPVNGETIDVLALHLKCPRCRETVLRLDQAQALREMAQAAYRRKHHLLSSSDIRTIRRRFRLTQAALARLLRLGPNTFSRWEAGRNVQSAAMDVVLRMLRDLPGSLKYLQRRAA